MSQIFNITHDAGNLNEYDALVNGTDLSATPAAAMASTAYGLQVLIDSTADTYGRKDFTQLTSTAYRFRFYLDPNTVDIPNNHNFDLIRIIISGSLRALVKIKYNGSNYQVNAGIRNDSWNTITTSFYTITDVPHFIEVLCQYATAHDANNGILTLWIDGAQQATITNVDLYDLSKPDEARIGAASNVDEFTSGTFFLDEFVLRNDANQIGPITVGGFANIF
jgi:hypothetical protein